MVRAERVDQSQPDRQQTSSRARQSDHRLGSAIIVIEAKRPGEALEDARLQAESYLVALRAPVYIVCNGMDFEIWQFQIALFSERLPQCPVPQLAAQRGAIETLLSAGAVSAYRATLQSPSLISLQVDATTYLDVEIARTGDAVGIARLTLFNTTLTDMSLLIAMPRGAVVSAASGMGKSWLLTAMHRRALSRALIDPSTPVPVTLDLPEINALGERLQDYAHARVRAHAPQYSTPRPSPGPPPSSRRCFETIQSAQPSCSCDRRSPTTSACRPCNCNPWTGRNNSASWRRKSAPAPRST